MFPPVNKFHSIRSRSNVMYGMSDKCTHCIRYPNMQQANYLKVVFARSCRRSAHCHWCVDAEILFFSFFLDTVGNCQNCSYLHNATAFSKLDCLTSVFQQNLLACLLSKAIIKWLKLEVLIYELDILFVWFLGVFSSKNCSLGACRLLVV